MMNNHSYKIFFILFALFCPYFHWLSELKQALVAEMVAGMVTEMNDIIVYRVCFWEILPEVLLEEARYLSDLEVSKDRLLVSNSLIRTEEKKELRKIEFVGRGDLSWCFALSSHGAGVCPLLVSSE